MTTHLDLDDVAAQSPLARRELADLRAAAAQARQALSELILTRDPIVYSDALRALDEALGPNAAVTGQGGACE